MADTLPINFPIPAESATANYNWRDIADGSGYVNFYGFNCIVNSTTNAYHLISETLMSYNISSEAVTTVAIDFDSFPFKTPRVVKGNAFLSFTSEIYKAAAPEVSASFNVKLQRVRGASVTDMADVTTPSYSTSFGAGVTGSLFKSWNVKLPVTQTNIAVADILRIKITPTETASPTTLYHDPAGRAGGITDTANFSSQFVLSIPFKIDL